MRKLQILSIDHKSHSTSERQAFALNPDQYDELSSYIQYVLGVHGHVYLSTCNRIEIYYDAEEDLRELIIEKWKYLAQINDENLQNPITTYLGSESCINHILQLCIGTKSAIVGDDQILSQLKKAFELARTNGTMSTLLERAYQTVMKLVLIIGAGAMAAQVVKYLPKFQFSSVSITNRTEEKAQKLVKEKNIEVVNYANIDSSEYDIVISCTDQGYGLVRNITQLGFYIDLSLASANIRNLSCPGILLEEFKAISLLNQRQD